MLTKYPAWYMAQQSRGRGLDTPEAERWSWEQQHPRPGRVRLRTPAPAPAQAETHSASIDAGEPLRHSMSQAAGALRIATRFNKGEVCIPGSRPSGRIAGQTFGAPPGPPAQQHPPRTCSGPPAPRSARLYAHPTAQGRHYLTVRKLRRLATFESTTAGNECPQKNICRCAEIFPAGERIYLATAS